MTCREMLEFLMDYLEGGLPEEQRGLFDQHLRECPPCVDYIDSYRETVQLGRRAFDDLGAAMPDDVPEGLIQAILAARQA